MNGDAAELARLRALSPNAELWTEAGGPLVYMPDLTVQSGGAKHKVDALLCPRPRDGYLTRLFFSVPLGGGRAWTPYAIMAGNWFAFSWQGISADQPWLDILASHLEAAK